MRALFSIARRMLPHRALRDHELIYATGGAAMAGVRGDFTTDGFVTESGAVRDTPVGWAAGIGGEYAVGNGWSLKAEHYVDLGRASACRTSLTNVSWLLHRCH